MAGKELTRRFAHNGGFCSLAYAPSVKDRILVTCGNDDLVKLHNLEVAPDEDGGINEIDHFDDSVLAVTVSPDGTRIAAGGVGSVAVLFKIEDGGADYERNATKAPLPIRDLCFSPDSNWLAVASDDEEIKVVNVENVQEIKTLKGHEGGVKSIAFDPKGEYLVSAGSDRSVRLWFLETAAEMKKLSSAYEKVPATQLQDGNPLNLCQVAWSPSGEFIAVAGSKDVKILERGSLKELDPCGGAHSDEVSMVQFSSNGLYLLTVDISGVVVVWDFKERESLNRWENKSKVLNAKWDPFSNSIALISIKGEYGLIDNVVPSDKPGPNDSTEDDDVTSEISQNDEGEGGVTWHDEPSMLAGTDLDGGFGMGRSFGMMRREPPQPAFQPQSTPVAASSKRRFLTYTTVGQITSRDETTYHAIEIEFADVNTGRPIRFNDYTGFTMAAMDIHGALFASPEVKEKGGKVTSSTISYRPFDAWAPQSDWTMTLDEGEEAQAVAVGSTFVAVATSKRMLRIFTTSGIQARVMMLRGPVLSMHGLISELAVLYHSPTSPGADGSQDVHFEWLDVDQKATIASGSVCMTPASKLEWVQLTDTGFLAIMDSGGIVSLYSPGAAQTSGYWAPVMDIKSLEKEKKMHKRDWLWPVAIQKDDIIGVLVKEEKRYPDVQSPTIAKFPLSMPLLSGTSAEEEAFVRNTLHTDRQAVMAVDEDDEAAVDAARMQLEKTLLQQINVACTQKKLARALDLAKLFSSEKGVAAAATLANRHRLTNLAERIDHYRQVRFQEVEEDEEQIQYEEEEEESYQPASRSVLGKRTRPQPQDDVEEEGEDCQQMDEDYDARASPSSKSTADTPEAPVVGQRRPMASLFKQKQDNTTDSRVAAATLPQKGGFLEKLAMIKKGAAAAGAKAAKPGAAAAGVAKKLKGRAEAPQNKLTFGVGTKA